MRLWKLWFEADFSFSVHIWLQVSIDLTLTSLINQSLQQSSPESSSFWNPADSWCHSYSMLTLKQEQTVFSRPGHGESKSEQQLSWPRVGTPPSATSEHRDLRLGGGGQMRWARWAIRTRSSVYSDSSLKINLNIIPTKASLQYQVSQAFTFP